LQVVIVKILTRVVSGGCAKLLAGRVKMTDQTMNHPYLQKKMLML
jgi:hypothetical protein